MIFQTPYTIAKAGKYVVRVGLASVVIVATGQAVYFRHWYEKSPGLPLPSNMKGIEYGLERVRNTIGEFKKNSENSAMSPRLYFDRYIENIQLFFTNDKKKVLQSGQSILPVRVGEKNKKVRLLILGDSLARGVGCLDASPVLPSTVAKVLSLALNADVEWRAEGLIGGTVSDIHTKYLPIISEELTAQEADPESNTEIVIVIICGVNDWKTMLTEFPHGSGPHSFRAHLQALISDIKRRAGNRPVKVVLPALPLMCGEGDPNCVLQRAPLKYFVSAVCSFWDLQKKYVAEEAMTDKLCRIQYIGVPDLSMSFATPGEGNVCPDGVHPSSQGYLWWAHHIAQAIIQQTQIESVDASAGPRSSL